jgi:ABC-type nitrate/sulfonate/bicarbonate transport system, permease component
MYKKKSAFQALISKIPGWVFTILSLLLALLVWQLISLTPNGGKVFASPLEVMKSLVSSISAHQLSKHFIASFRRIIIGFALAFVASIPVAFLLDGTKPFASLSSPGSSS